jgi:RNA recognition motif-containing protein
MVGQCIAAIATAKLESADNADLRNTQAGATRPVYITARRITQLKEWLANMNIYIGNLAFEVTEGELRQEFTAFGEVISVSIMDDKYIGSGQPRGYGFVEMPSESEGETAIAALNGKSLRSRTIDVIQALPLSDNKGNGSDSVKTGFWLKSRVRQRRY